MKTFIESIRVKKFLQYLFMVTFPVTLYYFSPYVVYQGATEGVVNGGIIVFVLLFVMSIFFGRLFCSTICPAGALQDCLTEVKDTPVKNGAFNYIKYLIWLPWLAGFLTLAYVSGGYKTIDFFYLTHSGVSVSNIFVYIIYFGVIAIFTLLHLTIGRRAGCHYICWMSPFMIIGMQMRKLLKLPGLTLKSHISACVSCKRCNNVCPMSLDVNQMVIDNTMTQSECILCGKCVDTCKKNTIEYSFKRG